LGALAMEEKNFRLKRLEKTVEKLDSKVDDLQQFKYSAIEKFKTIFKRLSDLEKSSKWVSQTFFYLLLSGVIMTVFSLIEWLITR